MRTLAPAESPRQAMPPATWTRLKNGDVVIACPKCARIEPIGGHRSGHQLVPVDDRAIVAPSFDCPRCGHRELIELAQWSAP